MLKSLLCALRGHRINRNRVRHNGLEFSTRCRCCKAQLVRMPEGWREADEAAPAHA